jgi:prepilin-type N-terminal cleavage/methylation domain-containing protein
MKFPAPMASRTRRSAGFSMLELVIGIVVASIVTAGVYRLWKTHQVQGYRLGKKIALRSEMSLSSKRIQRSVTLAGLGLNRVLSLGKSDAVGSDTLSVFTNSAEAKSGLYIDVSHSDITVRVQSPGIFSESGYLVLIDSTGGEARRIVFKSGSNLTLESRFSRDFRKLATMAYPASRQRFYTNQDSSLLICESNGRPGVTAPNIRNFQVSFRNNRGEATEAVSEVRAVAFSFTGTFPADAGSINSIVFSSTAIPRNVQ